MPYKRSSLYKSGGTGRGTSEKKGGLAGTPATSGVPTNDNWEADRNLKGGKKGTDCKEDNRREKRGEEEFPQIQVTSEKLRRQGI